MKVTRWLTPLGVMAGFVFSLTIGFGCTNQNQKEETLFEIQDNDSNGFQIGGSDLEIESPEKETETETENELIPRGWTPKGLWGADGNNEDWENDSPPDNGGGGGGSGGGSGGYKMMSWGCLICDDATSGNDAALLTEILKQGFEEAEDNNSKEPIMEEIDAPAPTEYSLSADDSNSQSSPVLARATIRSGQLVSPEKIRIWEFLNYYNVKYEPPVNTALKPYIQIRPYDWTRGLLAMQIGLQGKKVEDAQRRKMSVTLVLDTSGSMSGTPIKLVKDVARAIAGKMKIGDSVSMLSWSTDQNVLLDSLKVDGPDDERFLEEIDNIDPGGGTDLYSGLVAGYGLAAKNFVEGGMNRVILISDCQVNTGVLSEDIVAEASAGAETDAIYLVGVGVSDQPMGFPDEFMDTITDKGKGAYVYIDSAEEAHKMFHDRFTETMEIVAADVDVKVVLPTYFSIEDFFGEKLSKESKDVDTQHLAPGDTMILQETVRSLLPLKDVLDQTVRLEVSYTDVETSVEEHVTMEAEFGHLLNGSYKQLRKGDTIVVFAQTLGKTYRQIGKGKKVEALETCELGLGVVQESAKALDDEDLDEVAELLESYCKNLEDNWVPDYGGKNMWNCMICEGETTVSAENQRMRDADIIIATPPKVPIL